MERRDGRFNIYHQLPVPSTESQNIYQSQHAAPQVYFNGFPPQLHQFPYTQTQPQHLLQTLQPQLVYTQSQPRSQYLVPHQLQYTQLQQGPHQLPIPYTQSLPAPHNHLQLLYTQSQHLQYTSQPQLLYTQSQPQLLYTNSQPHQLPFTHHQQPRQPVPPHTQSYQPQQTNTRRNSQSPQVPQTQLEHQPDIPKNHQPDTPKNQQPLQNTTTHTGTQPPQKTPKETQQKQQDQQYKKQKKNLVGENQERINYLVQASRAMVMIATGMHSSRKEGKRCKKKRKKSKKNEGEEKCENEGKNEEKRNDKEGKEKSDDDCKRGAKDDEMKYNFEKEGKGKEIYDEGKGGEEYEDNVNKDVQNKESTDKNALELANQTSTLASEVAKKNALQDNIKEDQKAREKAALIIAAQTGALASAVGRRCVLRLSPGLKRTMCKGCGIALVYGVNARVRHRPRRQKHLVVTCLMCHTIKRFNCDPKHKLWFEQEEALI